MTTASTIARALTPEDFARRPPLWHPDLPCVVFWSHKAACTAVAHWFFAAIGNPQRAGPDFARHGYRNIRIHDYEAIYKAQPGYLDGCVAALSAGRPALKFVRDPAARAYSAYVATCRAAAVGKPAFWGAKVRAGVVAMLYGAAAERATPYTFPQFVEWLAVADAAAINVHVRPQVQAWETVHPREALPIEELQQRLIEVERRFALPAIAGDAAVLGSRHHRAKSLDLAGGELEQFLLAPLVTDAEDGRELPTVDSARLRGTALGSRLREVLAQDYAAYTMY